MITSNAPDTDMKERIQELRIFIEKIEQRIAVEQRQAQPDAELVARLKQERINLEDTLKRAQELSDKDKP